MEESEDNMSAEDVRNADSPSTVKSKPKKRSMVERELETNLTARVTSPVTAEGLSTSRYGRARRLKSGKTNSDAQKGFMKSPESPRKSPSIAYKMHASNSPLKTSSPINTPETCLEHQIENIYHENKSLSRFGTEEAISPSPAKKFPKVYIRKDLIQKREPDETVMLIKNIFSPTKSTEKPSRDTHLQNVLERSSERFNLSSAEKSSDKFTKSSNGYHTNPSVVKTLDFDSKKKKKKDSRDSKSLSKNELFELEAKCAYQVGDLAWARMGTFPFWPCIVTRDPSNGVFVKKKLFGRIERDVIHVTFFGDNGRRGWIVDTMLRKYLGQLEFETTREQFTAEDKKKDPRLYAAFFVSDKKQALWNTSVEEAEMLLREPKRLRIDIFNDMLHKSRALKPNKQKSSKITRTDSDVSLSESLYDSLFSEDDGKSDNNDSSRRTRNKSLDVFDVVTACLDNMAAKSGMTKIQRQSHMDRWLQKAKSKTPEKTQGPPLKVEKEIKISSAKKKKKTPHKEVKMQKTYSLRRSGIESQRLLKEEPVFSIHDTIDDDPIEHISLDASKVEPGNDSGVVSLRDENKKKEQADIDLNNCDELTLVKGAKETNCMTETTQQLEAVMEVELPNVNKKETDCFLQQSPKNEAANNLDEEKFMSTDDGQQSLKDNFESERHIQENFVEPKCQEEQQGTQADITNTSSLSRPDSENLTEPEMSEREKNDENIFLEKLKAVKTAKERDEFTGDQLDVNYGTPLKEGTLSIARNNSDLNKISTNTQADDDINISDRQIKTGGDSEKSIPLNEGTNNSVEDMKDLSNVNLSNSSEVLNDDSEDTSNIIFLDKRDEPSNIDIKSESQKLYDIQCEKPLNVTNKSIGTDNDEVGGIQIKQIGSNLKFNELNVKTLIQENVDNSLSKTITSAVVLGNNIFIDDDSDDEPLPYSPLSVDLNKDETLDELNDVEPIFEENGKDTPNRCNKEDDCQGDIKEIKASMDAHYTGKTFELESKSHVNGLISAMKSNGEIGQQYDSRGSLDIAFGLDNAIVNNKLGKSIIKPTLGDNELQLHSDQNKNLDNPNDKKSKQISNKSSLNNNNDIILHNVMVVDNMDQRDIAQSHNVSKKPTFNGHADEKELSTFKSKAVIKDVPIFIDTVNDFDSNKDFKADNKRQLRSTKNMKTENPLDNAEFIKYFELRQDYIMDENPELCHDEIVAYLYKTWLYEENIRTNTEKNEDQTTTVKGLEKETTKKRRKKLSLKRNKIDMFEKPMKSKGSEVYCTEKNIEEPLTPQETTDNKQELFTNEQCTETVTEVRAKNENDEDLQMASTSSMSIEAADDNNDIVLFPNLIFQEPASEFVDASIKLYCQEIVRHSKGNLPSAENNKKLDTSIEIYCQDMIRQGDENLTSHGTQQIVVPNNLIDKDEQINVREIDDDNTDTTHNVKEKCDMKDIDTESIGSEDSEAPLIECKLRSLRNIPSKGDVSNKKVDPDIAHIETQDNESPVESKPKKQKTTEKKHDKSLSDPEFLKYVELRQDALIDENPQLLHDEVVSYLHKAWLYEDKNKSELVKSEEVITSNLVKGLNDNVQPPKKIKRNKIKTEKVPKVEDIVPKEKPKRKINRACYNEEYSDIEEELEYFEIFRSKRKGMFDSDKNEPNKSTTAATVDNKLIDSIKQENGIVETMPEVTDNDNAEPQIIEVYDVAEYYFWNLTQPKTNVFKGLLREKVCEICENTNNLIKCRGCSGMFHNDCVKRQTNIAEMHAPAKTRKKKKKPGRKPKGFDDSGNQDDGSEDLNASIEDIPEVEGRTVDADLLEAQLTAKMKELLETNENRNYDSYSSDDGVDWKDSVPGKCEIVEVKLKPRLSQTDYSNFKCHNCQKYDTPICFVCKSAVSKTNNSVRQKCQVAHCHKYYHLECLNHWPQTQFNGTEFSKNKKIKAFFEPLTCPRHVCHTCVSDDPRGCKTRFSGDKLARCIKCPATYHSFTKCLPAGSQILTASYIICPRHYEHRPGKVPCHVNTGWCFLCALGGSLICCEYCPTSFHAECLNIKPPEGGYMCEDCETGRLPLYGEMVWVKLGHYRWWPGLILHPSEIPENIMAVKHSAGEFVVRFFGQYDHYWVNRGRVFPFQEGDSGRISSQKSKIDAAFTMAMEHAQKACQILKNAPPNEEESTDIASSLLPPHYVKLKVNKPCGSLVGRRPEDPETSLTQCECNPLDEEPCGAYSQCINRMLLTECGPICKAGDRCNNRAFEKRLYPKLVPYRTPSRGWGLKTLEDIKAGQFVIEYVGELIDEEEFRRRMDRKHEIRDENFYFLTLDKERMIDAGPKGNLARFMNHCCEPNCETQKWTVLGDVRVGLFALYDIPANSEVTFNYNLECAGIDKKRCMCGAKRCSGYIGAKPKQDDQLKKPKRPYNKKKKPESPLDTKPKPKRPLGRPPKPKPLTEIEKDLLIINSAASSDDSSKSVIETDKPQNPLKRRRVNFSTEEVSNGSESPSAKKPKVDNPVGD